MNERTKEWSSQKGDAFSRFGENIGKVLGKSETAKRAEREKKAKGKAKKPKGA